MDQAVSINPMMGQMSPQQQQLMQQIMMILGGLGPTVPSQPQPQASQQSAILGGLING